MSRETWGEARQVHLIGRSAGLLKAQEKLTRFARIDRPVLLMGESGVGKELFACALYLLSARFGKPFLRVNCAQYQNEELLVSELFGHRKGSFTGAHAERRGLFEEAQGGMVFLDEVGELSPRAQAMLLRVLSEGEIKPLGESRFRQVNVHIVAATNRSLKQMVIEKSFREDLFYRLRYLHLPIPPLRERDDDWRLILTFFLNRLNHRYHDAKQFSPAAWATLKDYPWPGNIREAKSIVDIGFCLAEGAWIEPRDFAEELEREHHDDGAGLDEQAKVMQYYQLMADEGESFWNVVREPFLDRELNRAQVRSIIERGLNDAEGSYKKMLRIFRVQDQEYLKFMDFLRHHRLKPDKARALR